MLTSPNYGRLLAAVVAAAVFSLGAAPATAGAQQAPPQPPGTSAGTQTLQMSVTELESAVAASENEVEVAKARLASAQANVGLARAASLSAVAASNASSKRLREAKRDTGRLAAALYVRGAKSVNVVLSATSMQDALRKKQLADVVAETQSSVLDELAKAEVIASRHRAAADEAFRAAETQVQAAEAERTILEAKLTSQRELLSVVAARAERALAEAAVLQAIDPALAARVDQAHQLLASIGGTTSGPPRRVTPPATASVGGIEVATTIAQPLAELLAAASAAGIRLGGGGYRDPMMQIALRIQNCGPTDFDIFDKPASACSPPTARPGTSLHERGLAIDFTHDGAAITSEESPAFAWLEANAGTFGFINLPGEPWHWSTTGS